MDIKLPKFAESASNEFLVSYVSKVDNPLKYQPHIDWSMFNECCCPTLRGFFPGQKSSPSKPLSTIGFHKFGLTKHGNNYVDALESTCYVSMRYSTVQMISKKRELMNLFENKINSMDIPDLSCMWYSFLVWNAVWGHLVPHMCCRPKWAILLHRLEIQECSVLTILGQKHPPFSLLQDQLHFCMWYSKCTLWRGEMAEKKKMWKTTSVRMSQPWKSVCLDSKWLTSPNGRFKYQNSFNKSSRYVFFSKHPNTPNDYSQFVFSPNIQTLCTNVMILPMTAVGMSLHNVQIL